MQSYWEGGGNCNLTIAGARLGLHCVTLGHVGNEKFGHFLHRVLENEGIEHVDIQEEDNSPIGDDDYDGSTLLCWVLVDPSHQHAFCRYVLTLFLCVHGIP
jgi:sugar/nucleoside kinase (ribokinase family)